MHKLRYRQVHLDFHTSPHISNIGKQFDKAHWQKTLKDAHVNSITCFATCHHGWSYFDTTTGKKHPHLNFELLREQFDACKETDINVPIYITAGVNNMVAHEHPEWREVGPDGQYIGWTKRTLDPGFHDLCFNSPYLDFLCEHIHEVLTKFPNCDGIFTDIIHQGQCCCRWCLEDMLSQGLDPEKEEDRLKFAEQSKIKYYKATTKTVKDFDPNMPIFHNTGHIQRGKREILKYFSHLELESLPTGGWGYDHFPMSAKYCKNLEYDFLGMTGKFHTSWGEFGGFKHPNALRYECAAMLAYGSKCSIGDQLHPEGKADESTYSLIGTAYKEVEEKEPWCTNTQNIADVAILSSVSIDGKITMEDPADAGATRILLEADILFEIIDAEMNFEKYKVLILPDEIEITPNLKDKLDNYLINGGKLFLSGRSGLNEDCTEFLFDLGAEVEGISEYSPDFIRPSDLIQSESVKTPFVMYTKSYRVKNIDAVSLGKVYDPYFNRSYKHFCSHQHTPYKPEASEFDCGIHKHNIVYLAHEVFKLYKTHAAVIYKEFVVKALNLLLDDVKTIKTNMPSTARISLTEQKRENRYVLHLLYANIIARGGMDLNVGSFSEKNKRIEIIEELLPLHDTTIELKLEKAIIKVTLEPQGIEIPFKYNNNKLELKIDKFTCHQMIVMNY